MRPLDPIAALLLPAVLALGTMPAARAEANPLAPHALAQAARVNGVALSPAKQAELTRLFGQPIPPGDYWYDAASGLWGYWGGPAQGVLPAGLGLGGPMPASCSGGGTSVFINGREIHPQDLAFLQAVLGTVVPAGRYFLDAQGNAGYEGGPPTVNLYLAAQQASASASGGGGGTWSWSSGSAGAIEGSAFVCGSAGDCSSWSP